MGERAALRVRVLGTVSLTARDQGFKFGDLAQELCLLLSEQRKLRVMSGVRVTTVKECSVIRLHLNKMRDRAVKLGRRVSPGVEDEEVGFSCHGIAWIPGAEIAGAGAMVGIVSQRPQTQTFALCTIGHLDALKACLKPLDHVFLAPRIPIGMEWGCRRAMTMHVVALIADVLADLGVDFRHGSATTSEVV